MDQATLNKIVQNYSNISSSDQGVINMVILRENNQSANGKSQADINRLASRQHNLPEVV